MSKEFTCFVVGQHFGPQYATLVAPLVDHEELLLSELARDCKIEVSELRPMLILLLKHSVVEFAERAAGGKAATYYRLNPESVVNLSLYPRYLAFLEDKVSVLARSLAETLMLGGMMTVDELLQATRDSIGLELEGEEIKDQDLLQEIGTLVSLHYFAPVHKSAAAPQADLTGDASLGKRKMEAEPAGKSKSGKKIKSSKNFLVEDSLEAGKLIDM